MMKWDLNMYKKLILFIVVLGFSNLSCVLPVFPQQESPTLQATITITQPPTPTLAHAPTPTSFPEIVNCKDIVSKKTGTVNASPIGLYLRKIPGGEIMAVIPHGSKLEILSVYNSGWSLVRWDNLCGYSGSAYIILD